MLVLLARHGCRRRRWAWPGHGGSDLPRSARSRTTGTTGSGVLLPATCSTSRTARSRAPGGELVVDERHPIQLSVPSAIGAAPWRLMLVYDDPPTPPPRLFRPHARLAVTIPTVDAATRPAARVRRPADDPRRRREKGELHDLPPHAEWSVGPPGTANSVLAQPLSQKR